MLYHYLLRSDPGFTNDSFLISYTSYILLHLFISIMIALSLLWQFLWSQSYDSIDYSVLYQSLHLDEFPTFLDIKFNYNCLSHIIFGFRLDIYRIYINRLLSELALLRLLEVLNFSATYKYASFWSPQDAAFFIFCIRSHTALSI